MAGDTPEADSLKQAIAEHTRWIASEIERGIVSGIVEHVLLRRIWF